MKGFLCSGNVLNTKMKCNHEITPAQENQQERNKMHTTLADALRARRDTGISPACPALHTDYSAIIKTIPPIVKVKSLTELPGDILARSDGVMTRVRMVNTTLKHLNIECSELDKLAGTGTTQLATAQAMVHVGNRQGIRSSLSQFRDTVTLLSNAYRGILAREDLSGETAQGILAVSRSLDVTVLRAGVAHIERDQSLDDSSHRIASSSRVTGGYCVPAGNG
jgi:hypothetical protein